VERELIERLKQIDRSMMSPIYQELKEDIRWAINAMLGIWGLLVAVTAFAYPRVADRAMFSGFVGLIWWLSTIFWLFLVSKKQDLLEHFKIRLLEDPMPKNISDKLAEPLSIAMVLAFISGLLLLMLFLVL